ncbi:hypothetical protein B0H14DRAFT_2575368 [Mycena olivaceomarginata]|nr:hypothetical protein B0H14DRAFT_2575368 [Mycena olivaceomarginata]
MPEITHCNGGHVVVDAQSECRRECPAAAPGVGPRDLRRNKIMAVAVVALVTFGASVINLSEKIEETYALKVVEATVDGQEEPAAIDSSPSEAKGKDTSAENELKRMEPAKVPRPEENNFAENAATSCTITLPQMRLLVSAEKDSFRLRRTLEYRRKPVIAATRFCGEPVAEEARVPDDHGRKAQVAHHNEQDARRTVCTHESLKSPFWRAYIYAVLGGERWQIASRRNMSVNRGWAQNALTRRTRWRTRIRGDLPPTVRGPISAITPYLGSRLSLLLSLHAMPAQSKVQEPLVANTGPPQVHKPVRKYEEEEINIDLLVARSHEILCAKPFRFQHLSLSEQHAGVFSGVVRTC